MQIIARVSQYNLAFAAALCTLAVTALSAYGVDSRFTAKYGGCPSAGFTSSTQMLHLKGDCEIAGDVDLSGSAALAISNGTLSITGNVVLNGDAALTVGGGALAFPQTNYSQYSVTLNGHSHLTLKDSAMVTNGTTQNNFSMLLQANDFSSVDFENSALDTSSGSWLLGDFNGRSRLTTAKTQNLPTEIYPADAARISISSGSSFAALWLQFVPGSKGTVNIPRQDSQGHYNFIFGPGTGIAYSVDISSSSGRLGLNSHPDSTLIVNGRGAFGVNDAAVVLGYYVENHTGPVSIDGLTGGSDITREFTDSGRKLLLNRVNLGPFSWQVYVRQSDNFPVSVTNSKVNEIAALSHGLVNISNCILQLAVTEAGGPGAVMNISGSQIWSQTLLAEAGGQMSISDSQLHGNFISAAGAGSSIALADVGEERNGVPPQSCSPINGYPPNVDGDPLCNPFNPLDQCSQVVPPTGGATFTANPTLTCPPQ
ncbi:MAG: hypothetical protein ABSF59_20425 [Candidatus Sulfotelmatobacter sp.]